jgi:glycosyltransferase involved in cell wall biosynthesis
MPEISFKNLLKYNRSLSSVFKHNSEYTIVHSHIDALSTLPLFIAKKAGVAARIAHAHSTSFEKNIKSATRHLSKNLIRFVATDYAGCSQQAIDFMFGTHIKRSIIIKNAIDTAKFRFNKQARLEIRRKYGIGNNTLVIGHVGNFTYAKNHKYLIDVFTEILKTNKDAKLMLIGQGKLKNVIEKKVRLNGISERVMFMGSRTDVADLMQSMDIFVMPSIYEGLPVVSIEAQASDLQSYFSTAITKDVKITKICHFIDLNQSAKVWAKQICETNNRQRYRETDTKQLVSYDISIAASSLYRYYMDRFNNVRA